MNSKEIKNLTKAVQYNNSTPIGKKLFASIPEQINQDSKEKIVLIESGYVRQENSLQCKERAVSAEKLQDAIIWSEILAKPAGKRRKRRL
jgi:hypothetical protein